MLRATADRFLLALQYKDYRTLWIATTCSGAAAWALIIARGWLAYELTGGLAWVGVVTFAAMAPRVFTTPFVGYLADRFDRQTIMQWVFALNLAHNIILAFLVMNDMAGAWTLTALALMNGTLRAGQMTVASALIPNLVPRQHLLNALALNQATQQGSRMVGALAILPLLQFINIEMAFWLCSAFYAIGLLSVTRVTTRSTGKMDETQGFWRNLAAGFEYVYRRPIILAMILLVLGHCALTMSYESILPAISDDKLGARVGGYELSAGRGRRRGRGRVHFPGRSPRPGRQGEALSLLRLVERGGADTTGGLGYPRTLHRRRVHHGGDPGRVHDHQPHDYPNADRR